MMFFEDFLFKIQGKRRPILCFERGNQLPIEEKKDINCEEKAKKGYDEYPIVFKESADKLSTGREERERKDGKEDG